MKRLKMMIMAVLSALTTTFTCVSCGTEVIEVNPIPTVLDLSCFIIDLDFDKGSLSEEYYQQIVTQLTKSYKNEDGTTDVKVFMDKYVAAPLQTKLDEIASASGCYDFSVTITVREANDKEKVVYSKTVAPIKPE